MAKRKTDLSGIFDKVKKLDNGTDIGIINGTIDSTLNSSSDCTKNETNLSPCVGTLISSNDGTNIGTDNGTSYDIKNGTFIGAINNPIIGTENGTNISTSSGSDYSTDKDTSKDTDNSPISDTINDSLNSTHNGTINGSSEITYISPNNGTFEGANDSPTKGSPNGKDKEEHGTDISPFNGSLIGTGNIIPDKLNTKGKAIQDRVIGTNKSSEKRTYQKRRLENELSVFFQPPEKEEILLKGLITKSDDDFIESLRKEWNMTRIGVVRRIIAMARTAMGR